MNKISCLKSVFTLAVAIAAGQAGAASILSSYPVGIEGSSFTFSASSWESFGFKTGPTNTYLLDSVTMRLSAGQAGIVDVSLYGTTTRTRPCGWSQDTGTKYCNYLAPDKPIGSFVSTLVGAKADYTFRPASELTLLPETLYWVVFKAAGGESFRYYERPFSDVPHTGDPGQGLSPWKGLYSSQTGAQPFDFAKSPGFDLNPAPGVFVPSVLGQDWMYHSGLNIYSIEGTLLPAAIPEPTTLALMLVGGLVLIAYRRAAASDRT